MSYTPTTWADNDVITVQKLNKMEQGLAGQKSEVFIINITPGIIDGDSSLSTDKTYSEIKDAFLAGKTLMIKIYYGEGYEIAPVLSLYESSNEYNIIYYDIYNERSYQLRSSSNNTILTWINETVVC